MADSSLVYQQILENPDYQSSKRKLMEVLSRELQKIQHAEPAKVDLEKSYEAEITTVNQKRGRELFFKWISSGAGNGPFVELRNGSIKYDLITGIGVNFFGHGNLELFEAQFDHLWGDVMQGNLGPNQSYHDLMKILLQEVGPQSRLDRVWLSTCGAIANEVALKIIRQKKFPATKVFAFKQCFLGRTTALQELTDNPKYREGQPLYGEAHHLPFFNPHSPQTPQEQAAAVIQEMKKEMANKPNQYCCLEFEIVQGEGGFRVAPREFWIPILTEARKLGLAIWDDEIQTFGRTGELFCYQRFGLEEYIDVVTVAKLLQTGAVLYNSEYNPKAGLVSATFAGASSSLSAATKAIEILKRDLCGPSGKILKFEKQTQAWFQEKTQSSLKKCIVDYTVIGGMVAFTPFDGSLENVKRFLFKLWDLGAAAFYCGHGPYRVRMLPPFGGLTQVQWQDILNLIERAMLETAREL